MGQQAHQTKLPLSIPMKIPTLLLRPGSGGAEAEGWRFAGRELSA